MKTINLVRFAAAALLAAGALSAQTGPWDASASLVLPLDGLKAVTQTKGLGGATLEGGYNNRIANTKIPFRLSASLNVLPGEEANYVKSSLLGLQGAAEVLVPTGFQRLDMVAGLSLNWWRWDYEDATHHATETIKGAKMGARFGFEYHIDRRWSASALLQMTELGVNPDHSHGYNPSWIQVGAKYHF